MPPLQGRVPKLISSSFRIRKLLSFSHSHFDSSPPPLSGFSSMAPLLENLRWFSSTNGKPPLRASDDLLRQNPESDLHGDDSKRSVQLSPPEPIPNRPLRGDKPFNQSPPDFRESNRAHRSFSLKFDDENSKAGNGDKTNKFSQGSPSQNLNRNMAGRTKRDESDESFLDKFKLAFDNNRGKPRENGSSVPSAEENKTNPNPPDREPAPQDADEIFKRMKETGLIPNAVAMLDGLCKDGLVQEAMKLFGLMREKGTIPEVVIYTAVVEGFAKAQKPEDAKRIFRKMQNNGISPNAFSYTVIIQGLYKCNKLEDAVDFCVEMLEAGHSPNVTTFVGLVGGFCKEKGVEEAQSLIRTLREKGFCVNEKAVREFLDKKAPFSPPVWEAIFGKKAPRTPF
ncbi:Pentatricopeptide repeat-containing protein family [Quillaja saponaria]|uniref:Pentatricopeptide repeat-containing protein family n=1 Tax=Quillaja saponaria TaxID=32244 RepID=A0AAD7Q6Q3_QUISA|nr:Pentatricopeptide repeat-containing protein family [Quillaja saponaria]KAJ7975891.1 Pentatricopeptide repeat-containing protein family [Quillaja saponaria]